ncbi:hypothetical protein [Citrobacter sp. CtB7.12]|nr:hypothetical protein [Citrobacter sp. CtB7.12]
MATLPEMELADYCRRIGLFVEQAKVWQLKNQYFQTQQYVD